MIMLTLTPEEAMIVLVAIEHFRNTGARYAIASLKTYGGEGAPGLQETAGLIESLKQKLEGLRR